MKKLFYFKFNRYYVANGVKHWYTNRLLTIGLLGKLFHFELKHLLL